MFYVFGLLLASLVSFVAGVIFAYLGSRMVYDAKVVDLRLRIAELERRGLPPRSLEVRLRRDRGGVLVRYVNSIDADKALDALCLVACGSHSFSVRGLSGVLTRTEFESLRDDLFHAGLACWSDSGRNVGISWTREGVAFLDLLRGSDLATD